MLIAKQNQFNDIWYDNMYLILYNSLEYQQSLSYNNIQHDQYF